MNIVDLIIIVLLLLGAIFGYRKGFLNSVIGLLSSIVGLFVALKYNTYLTNWFDKSIHLSEIIGNFFKEHLSIPISASLQGVNILSVPDLSVYMDKAHLPENIKSQLSVYIQELGNGLVVPSELNMGDVLYMFLAGIVVKVIAIIIIWLVLAKLMVMISHLITRISDGTILGFLNRLGGLVAETFIVALILVVIFGFINPIFYVAGMTEPSFFAAMTNTIGEASLVPYFVSVFAFLSNKLVMFCL
ncbi:MAG: CvpA family protein [Clostridia bacterium]|nr:CvpA family protein [Clostridia bacterium]MDD4047394.1 CvpA family protein [Clostridia bacterium]